MLKLNPMLLADFYKLSHRKLYPKGTEVIYSTWTPRASRVKGVNEVVVFGLQAFVKEYLVTFFNENFFNRDIKEIIEEYSHFLKFTLGDQNPETAHIEELHKLGYLPIKIKALDEGTVVPIRLPIMTIENTDPRFFWLTNYIETLISCELWQPSTSATLAREYRKILNKYAMETVGNTEFVTFQGHDFSMRGMSSLRSAVLSGMGHLTQFCGTDTIPAIQGVSNYYSADIEKGLVGTSIPASEHSIQCSYGNDLEYLRRIITEVHPSGLVSLVSDGFDFWDVIGRVLPLLKDDIMARKGGVVGDKVVIRPDSGDPVLIVCGDPNGKTELERKGAVEALWDLFGGTINSKGFKELDTHIGLIYGDAITLNRCEEISERLKQKGFASTNCVYGIGSYTYQYNTRDTFGFALKSTSVTINGEEKAIFKDPKTDDGIKKSLKGRVAVVKSGTSLKAIDSLTSKDVVEGNLLKTVFENGEIKEETTFDSVRELAKVK